MSATSFHEYAQNITTLVSAVLQAGQAASVSLEIDQRSALRGYIKGQLLFDDNAELHFREFIDITLPDPRIMYAYHYQGADKALIFRYDNAIHRPMLTQPEHKHLPGETSTGNAPALSQVIEEILART